jgi:hypothetical protein
MLVNRFSSFRRNTKGGQAGNWVILSYDSVQSATEQTIFPAAQISTAAGVEAQQLTTSEGLLY